MMRVVRLAGALAVAAWSSSVAAAPNLALAPSSESGFRRVIEAASDGALGGDVTGANVQIEHARVRIELRRRDGARAVLTLTPKRSGRAAARYFEIAAGAGATLDDVRRLGRALDEAFIEDPFRVTGLEEPPDGEAIPSLAQAWRHDTWRGVLRVLQRRMMVLPSLAYTAAVTGILAAGLLAVVLLLWLANPPPQVADDR